ncbi:MULTISPECIES: acyl-CoA dehydrogenase family protein [Streptomyces]|uniref:Acyl-CoA dehydrogenase n=1 Tax=Streptomyces rutgersensis TaxID=53451 RepID=A0ABX6RGZ1_9ACTN|nr:MULTISPECIES: acyl-CoA dehydrogenase family protein [Streptomyces]MDQ0297243.1 alkylation response protein AidB-like acyl-CoA dehydrogenase [Streptomyces sp. DSM 41037]QNE79945.1 acyl-CoA dehydrogenase [Streptomyces rutgersensis]WSU39101.1 acyl-CoA/acyl-ACP dehydrogenase [Streptomyces gougerotii]
MSATPRLLATETEDDLRAAVRSLLTAGCVPGRVLSRAESGTPYDRELWKTLTASMGLAGLLVPEADGGQGASHREAAVVVEELGRAVAPVPYLTGAVVTPAALLALPDRSAEASALLTEVAAGTTVAVLALPLTTASGDPLPEVTSADGALHGSVRSVADAAGADVLLVAADCGLYAVPAGAPGVTVTPLTALDLTRPLAAVHLDGVRGTLLAPAADALAAVRAGLLAGAGLLASEQLGLAEWCLTETVRHLKDRHQFNRPLGSFQALKHRLAQLWLDVAGVRPAATAAADRLATGEGGPAEAELAVAVAQVYASPVAVRAAEEALQLHGGIGMTWEHPVHLYLKRAKGDAVAYGGAGRHGEVVARLAELPAP